MPTISGGDLTTIRTYPQTVRRYLSFYPNQIRFSGQVNGTPSLDTQTGGIYQFAYDNAASGSFGDVRLYNTVVFGTTPGARDLGVSRVRKLPTSNTFYIAETAQGKLPIENDHYFTVLTQWRPWAKLPRLVGVKNNAGFVNSFTEYHDYDLAYSNQNTQIKPKANITASATDRKSPKPAGWLDDGQTYRTVILSAAFSFAMATGATISSYFWNVGDGTIVSGTTGSTTITVRFPEGARMISLTVTDSNSQTHTMYWPIMAHGDTFQPITNFEVTNDTRDEGREMGFTFFGQDGTADETLIPEGSLVCYWEEAEFGGEAAPDQYIDQFMGWTTSDSEVLKLGDESRYSISVGGIQSWLAALTGFAQKISDKASINRWYKMANITVDRVVHYVLREYTTALEICNLYLSGITTLVKAEEIKKSDIWTQLTDLQQGNAYCHSACDSLNGIWFRRHYSYLEVSERSPIDIVINLDKQDWTHERGLEIGTEKTDRVSVVTGAGSFISSNKDKLAYSKAPGLVPAQTGNDEEAPFQRLTMQTVNAQIRLNRFTGHHYARVNNPRNEVSIELIGNLDILEQAWCEPVTLTWQEESIRGVSMEVAEFLVTRISVSHSNQFGVAPKTITWTLEQATVGEPGVTYVPPKNGSVISIPSIVFPKIDFPTFQFSDWYNLPPSVPTMAVIPGPTLISGSTYYNAVFIAENTFSDAPIPEFNEFPLYSGVGGTRQIIDYLVDPRSPYYIGTGSTVNGWLITSHNVIRHTDLFGARSGSVQYTFSSSLLPEGCISRSSRSVAGWQILAVSDVAGNIHVLTTQDGGLNWENNLSFGYTTVNDAFVNFLHLSERVPGLAYVGRNMDLYRTLDYGQTWELMHSGGLPIGNGGGGRWIHCPLHDNPQDRSLWFTNDGNVVIIMSLVVPADETNWLFKVRDVENIISSTVLELPWPSPELYNFSALIQNEANPGKMVAAMTTFNGFTFIATSDNAGKTFKRKSGTQAVTELKSVNKNPNFIYGLGFHFNPDDPSGDPANGNPFVFLSRNFAQDVEIKSWDLYNRLNVQSQKVEFVTAVAGIA